jgi:hypothetical protein
MAIWERPIYRLTTKDGKRVVIDVTLSVNPNLGPNKAIKEVIEFFQRKNVSTVLDFGAGALRHTLPLLRTGFKVCAVDFEEQYSTAGVKRICREKRLLAEASPNFSALVYPRDFINDTRFFDAALLLYTFQGMPLENERKRVLRLLYNKLQSRSFIVWMSRYDRTKLPEAREVKDGYYKNVRAKQHSFYREWKTAEIHNMMAKVASRKRFYHLRSLGAGGRDQIFVYSKKKNESWV